MKKLVSLALAMMLALSLCVSVMAAEAAPDQSGSKMNYVVDVADLLSYDEWEELEQRAAQISGRYGCGVYIVTLDDYEDYGSGSVYQVTTQIYHNQDNGFGMGSGRDGILLLLSMRERDWAMFVYGDKAAYAFSSYAQERLEEVFLDNLEDNDWYGGFSDYLNTCGEYLARAQSGDPVRRSPGIYIMCAIGISVLLALVVCLVLRQTMVTVHRKVQADEYIAAGGVKLSESRDQFTHITETRRKIEKSDNSRSESGGGGSGRSGKF